MSGEIELKIFKEKFLWYHKNRTPFIERGSSQ